MRTNVPLSVFIAAVIGVLVVPSVVQARTRSGTDLGSRVAALEAANAALAEKLQFVTTNGTTMTISGANLQVVNGEGETETTNALGNVIIGYQELRSSDNDRTGSHMLVVGERNNYSGAGGIVVGTTNETSALYACVSGGRNNTASGFASSVSGGEDNIANAIFAAVSGGAKNVASGFSSSVSGGEDNEASGFASSVSGGDSNTASGVFASVGGGLFNVASLVAQFLP